VAHSAKGIRALASLAVLTLAALIAGCSTTMQQAARLQLNSARIRASEHGTRVTVAGRRLSVKRVGTVSAHGTTAFVVAVRNNSTRQLSDIPISVGVRIANGRRLYLNAQSGREDFFFDAHLPIVAPGRTLTWVYTTHRRLPSGARPFAIVGGEPQPPVPAVGDVPAIRATVASQAALRKRPGHLRVVVENLSSVPQYQLQVYAVARNGPGYLAAGDVTVSELAGQARRTLELGLVGRYAPGRLQVKALPTTLQ